MTHCPHYRLIAQQSRDIEDLLNLIKELEVRIIELEVRMTMLQPSAPRGTFDLQHDAWYWDH